MFCQRHLLYYRISVKNLQISVLFLRFSSFSYFIIRKYTDYIHRGYPDYGCPHAYHQSLTIVTGTDDRYRNTDIHLSCTLLNYPDSRS